MYMITVDLHAMGPIAQERHIMPLHIKLLRIIVEFTVVPQPEPEP